MNISSDELNFIGECFLKDIHIECRSASKALPDLAQQISKLTNIFASTAGHIDVVYTAFDGDHFHLLQNMRKCVLKNDFIPANPESILGYKNVVTRYQTKYSVLLDDLAILQKCDQLWVFTDYGTSIDQVVNLPEGVLVEIAFFLKRRINAKIFFISISELITSNNPTLKKFNLSFEDLESAFIKSDRREIVDLANNDFKVDSELKSLALYISDPLDFKYAEWLRETNNDDEVALVPGLAVRISDADADLTIIGKVVLSWFLISAKLSQKRGYIFESFDSKRQPSIIAESLKRACVQLWGGNYLKNKKWTSYNIPKAMQKHRWPITKFESKNMA